MMKKILFVLLLSSMYVLTEANAINSTETSLVNTEIDNVASEDYTKVKRVIVYMETYAGFVEQGSVEIYKDSRGYLYVLQNYGAPISVLNCSNQYFRYKFYMGANWYYFNM